ncbi:hypothetical protein [Aeromonas phage 59.1]|nr:hypothetical protein [Aeromonas phage 59.1]
MKGKIVYIAGPISNCLDTYFLQFAAAEAQLKHKGAIVINPAMLPIGLRSHQSYMNICLPMVNESDMVVMLPGWRDSKGAVMEATHGAAIGLPVFELHEVV